jgi:hypothetical protein
MRFIQIQDNVVVNFATRDDQDIALDGWQQHDTAPIGWLFNGTEFVPPTKEPPLPPTQAEQEANRQAAYVAEADPMAMQMLRDEVTKDEWLAKINEIKARFPYPVN